MQNLLMLIKPLIDWAEEIGKLSALWDQYWPIYGGGIMATISAFGSFGGVKISQLIANVKLFTKQLITLQNKTNGVIDTVNVFTGETIGVMDELFDIVRAQQAAILNPTIRAKTEIAINKAQSRLNTMKAKATIANIDIGGFVNKVSSVANTMETIIATPPTVFPPEV